MSSTPDNTGVLPFAQDSNYFFTEEDLDMLKYHMAIKIKQFNLENPNNQNMLIKINQTVSQTTNNKVWEFLNDLRCIKNSDNAIQKMNNFELADIPFMLKLLRLFDYDFFLSSIRTRMQRLPLSGPSY